MFLAACCWGTGFVVAALGVAVDQLWIVYLGYGVIGGIGLGIGYISPPLSDALLNFYGSSPADAVAPAFLTLGIIYFTVMTMGALTVKVTTGNVTAANAIRTPQFWLLWVVLFCNVTAGIGILEQASPMIQDHFDTVSAAAAAGFVGLLSLCNMSGRLVWSSTSDGAVLYCLADSETAAGKVARHEG